VRLTFLIAFNVLISILFFITFEESINYLKSGCFLFSMNKKVFVNLLFLLIVFLFLVSCVEQNVGVEDAPLPVNSESEVVKNVEVDNVVSDVNINVSSKIVVEAKIKEEVIEPKKEELKVATEKKIVSQNVTTVTKAKQPGWSSSVSVTKTVTHMVVAGNGIPMHQMGSFPMMMDGNSDGRPDNPNTVSAQKYNYKIPLMPKKAGSTTALPMGPIAIALSGAVFFNPLNAEKQDAIEVEVFDMCQGHPEMQGRYHYHQLSDCLEVGSEGHSFLIGYAFDGFGIYGPHEDTAVLATGLDSCNGHMNTELGYHYHTTSTYPYVLGCYGGVVESANFDVMGAGGGNVGAKNPPPPMGQGPPPPKGGPPPPK